MNLLVCVYQSRLKHVIHLVLISLVSVLVLQVVVQLRRYGLLIQLRRVVLQEARIFNDFNGLPALFNGYQLLRGQVMAVLALVVLSLLAFGLARRLLRGSLVALGLSLS